MKLKPFIFYSLLFILIFSGTGLASETAPSTTKLTIHIEGFENSNGMARVALINSKENYGQDKLYKGFVTKITKKQVILITDLPRGEYAVKVFHDENENEQLDTRIFGIPAESYGFSNNARGTMGPPEYEKAVFLLDTPEKRIDIQIK